MSIQTLISVMETLLEQHEQLLGFAEQRNQALMENDINKLSEIVTKESRIAKLVAAAEEQRKHAVVAIGQQVGLKLSEPKVSDIVQYVTNLKDKMRVIELSERLLTAIDQLRRLIESNRNLLEHAMDINNFSLELLTGGFDQEFVYKNPIHPAGQTKRSLFDSRA